MKWAKRVGMVVVLLAVLGLVAYGFMPRPVPVDTAAVSRGQLAVTVDEEGRTRVRDRFVLSAPIAGRIERIGLKVGDTVESGALVTRLHALPAGPLDPRARAQAEAAVQAADAARRQADAQVAAATADLAFADSELARIEKLLASGNATREAREAAGTRQASASAALDSARFGAQAAAWNLEAARAALLQDGGGGVPLEVRSPVRGQVLRLMRESEGPAMAGEMLLEIGDPAGLELVADFLSRDAVRIQPRMKARIERWGGAGALNAVVRRVEPYGFTKVSALGVEEQRVNVVLDFADGPGSHEALGDGYRVEVRVILEESVNVLKVPAGAVFTVKEGSAVFVVSEGRAALTPVKSGRRNGLEVEILEGLTEGTLVVLHPPDTVQDGKQVSPR